MKTFKRLTLVNIIFWLGLVIAFGLVTKFKMQFVTTSIISLDTLLVKKNFIYIFINNILMCCIFIVGAGVITLPLLFYQGVIFGFSLGIWAYLGLGMINAVLLVLPHAIFEIPAVFWSSIIGVELFIHIKSRVALEKLNIVKFFVERKCKLISISFLILLGALIESFATFLVYERAINYVK